MKAENQQKNWKNQAPLESQIQID
ncbi:hypothetical protein O6H91_02G099100 [Diphasiastrum complanatum]|uniref:Uncharacterized protein n=1 Tax=Diphasiastrum complanatum TaxID=34168 RepID=A0ACC2EJ02_DIPCM|nr:hypothetical protein O6H91_02G099100 [Diphasiastrum complanatum]